MSFLKTVENNLKIVQLIQTTKRQKLPQDNGCIDTPNDNLLKKNTNTRVKV